MKQTNEILHGAITRLLRPLARILLRHNISFLTFSDLAPGTKYLGSVAYGGAAGMPDPTIVRVDTAP